MTVDDLIALRKKLGLTQAEMGKRMGVAMRTIQDLEAGISKIKPLHVAAAERIALALAIEREEPMLAPVSVRRQALALARMLQGEIGAP